MNIISRLKTKYVNVQKMMPLSVKIRDRLFVPLVQNVILSQRRTSNLAWRIKLSYRFLDFVLKYGAAHGSASAVKWLKAGLVAIQKELGQDRLRSLQSLGAPASYSKTAGGLPRIIPAQQRAAIRRGEPNEIRF